MAAEAPGFLSARHARVDRDKAGAALDLSRRLPALLLTARQAAARVEAGLHGRRRAGPGENFWQFRPFVSGEPAQAIDWRRSARDEKLFVREREWEAARALRVWADLSGSMNFRSSAATVSKLDRALVLALALADAAARANERAGWLGLGPVSSARDVAERIALRLIAEERRLHGEFFDLPTAEPLGAREKAALIGDFLVAPEDFAACLAKIAARGARGHVLMIFDPVEQDFPFAGESEFYDETGAIFRAGRAQTLKSAFQARLHDHRETLRAIARQKNFSFSLHATDRPAAEALLELRRSLSADGAA